MQGGGRQRRTGLWGALAAVLLLVAGPAAAAPQRIVSLDYCTDAELLALAPTAEIAALSPDARAPYAFARERAQALPQHDGSVEAILALRPDLVVGSGPGTPRLAALLDRFAIPHLELGHASSLDEARSRFLRLGVHLGREDTARRLLAALDRRLAALRARVARLETSGPPPRAVYLTPSGVTTGAGTYIDEVLRLAGIRNALAAEDVHGWTALSVEGLLAHPPDLFVRSFFGSRAGWQENWRFSRHPATAALVAATPAIDVPAAHWGCAGIFVVAAIADLVRGRERLAAQRDALAAAAGQ
ncbi:MAG: ABC transporter substrate-binding protein [Rhodothalassiaceae bacterium]